MIYFVILINDNKHANKKNCFCFIIDFSWIMIKIKINKKR